MEVLKNYGKLRTFANGFEGYSFDLSMAKDNLSKWAKLYGAKKTIPMEDNKNILCSVRYDEKAESICLDVKAGLDRGSYSVYSSLGFKFTIYLDAMTKFSFAKLVKATEKITDKVQEAIMQDYKDYINGEKHSICKNTLHTL